MKAQTKSGLLARVLVLAILSGVLAAPLTIVHSDTSYTITGTVVNNSGNSISGVTISIYSASTIVSGSNLVGQYVKSVTTDDNGYFKVGLDRKSYTLNFNKAGYQTSSLSVSLNSATEYNYDLSKIELKRSITLQATPSTLEVHDGETFTIPLTIKNAGEDEVVSITVICGKGYSVSVISQDKQLVQSVYIPASGSATVSVKVTTPIEATDSDLVIKVVGNLETDYTVHLKAMAVDGDVLSCTYPGRNVMPSETFAFAVTVENPYYYTETFKIDLNTPSHWRLNIENDRGEKINLITLGAGESVSIQVTGEVPYNSTVGDYSFTLKASASGHIDELPLTVTVNNVSAELTITSKYPSQTIALGKTTIYPLTITNPGTKQLINFKAEGVPSGWTIAFQSSEGKQINSILVGAEASESVNLVVTPALSSSKSGYSFTVTATGDYSSGKITLEASIGGSYGLTMKVDSLYFETNAGSTYTETITLTNTGYSSLNNLYLSLSYPSGWTVTATPIKVTTLDPNSKTTFTLSISPPTGTAAQDYLVQVTGISDELEASQQSIRVTVNVESSWSIYGLVLLVVAAGAFVLLYKKLRRR